MTNCPNCGAPITGRICEYCGTVHWQDNAINTAETGGLSKYSPKPASCTIETVADGKRVLVAIPLWVDYCLFDSCDEVQTTTINAKPAEPDVFDFTICQFDDTVQILSQLAQGTREYYFAIRDKQSKRLIVEQRIIGRLTVKGFGSQPETLRIAITAEGPVDSRWEAV